MLKIEPQQNDELVNSRPSKNYEPNWRPYEESSERKWLKKLKDFVDTRQRQRPVVDTNIKIYRRIMPHFILYPLVYAL